MVVVGDKAKLASSESRWSFAGAIPKSGIPALESRPFGGSGETLRLLRASGRLTRRWNIRCLERTTKRSLEQLECHRLDEVGLEALLGGYLLVLGLPKPVGQDGHARLLLPQSAATRSIGRAVP